MLQARIKPALQSASVFFNLALHSLDCAVSDLTPFQFSLHVYRTDLWKIINSSTPPSPPSPLLCPKTLQSVDSLWSNFAPACKPIQHQTVTLGGLCINQNCYWLNGKGRVSSKNPTLFNYDCVKPEFMARYLHCKPLDPPPVLDWFSVLC